MKIYFFFHSNYIINLIYQKATYIFGCGGLKDIREFKSIISSILIKKQQEFTDIYSPETFIDFYGKVIDKKIIIVNEQEEDVTDLFIKENHLVKCYLIKSKIYKYKYVDNDYEKKIERNDVHIYKTIFYPPKSKSQNTN